MLSNKNVMGLMIDRVVQAEKISVDNNYCVYHKIINCFYNILLVVILVMIFLQVN